MKIEWVVDEQGLGELAAAWDDLVPAGEPPFFRHRWFVAWWRAFGGGRRLAVATAWEGERLAGVLPLSRRGSQLLALANDHSPIFRPLGDEQATDALLEAAVRSSSVLTAPALTATEPSTEIWRARARAAPRLVLEQVYQRQPIVRTDGAWEAYQASLDRNFRRGIERRRRRLDEAVTAVQIVLEPPWQPARQLTLGFAAEASGWKSKRGTAILSDPPTEAFYRELAAVFAEEQALRISALEVDGRYAAFDLSVVGGNRVWILKGGFDEEFRRYAPGLALTLAQIERAHELGFAAVELLGQSVPWKLRFARHGREQVFLGAYARTPGALGRYALRRGRPLALAAYRRLPGREVR